MQKNITQIRVHKRRPKQNSKFTLALDLLVQNTFKIMHFGAKFCHLAQVLGEVTHISYYNILAENDIQSH